jgi:RNA polymerase sigma factor (sigma-70 family)
VDDAIQKRFENNRKIVDAVSGSLIKKYAPFCQYEELIQWGLIGLWDACKRYQGPENEFRNYAKIRINGQIIDEIRISHAFVRRLKKEDHPKFIDIFEIQLPYEQVSVDDLIDTRRRLNKILESMSSVLTNRERYVINQYCFNDYTMLEIAKSLNLTEARVSQIKSEAVQKLIANINYVLDFDI